MTVLHHTNSASGLSHRNILQQDNHLTHPTALNRKFSTTNLSLIKICAFSLLGSGLGSVSASRELRQANAHAALNGLTPSEAPEPRGSNQDGMLSSTPISVTHASNTATPAENNFNNPLEQMGDIPRWVIAEGEVTRRALDPAQIIGINPTKVENSDLLVSYELTGGQSESLVWANLNTEENQIVFQPLPGLLGDETTDVFEIVLRAKTQIGDSLVASNTEAELEPFVFEVRGNITIHRLAEDCHFIKEVLSGESLDPLGGSKRFAECQSKEGLNNKSARLYLLEATSKILGYGASAAAGVLALLTAAAVMRDQTKRIAQPEVDQTLHRILDHLLQADILDDSTSWDVQILNLFSELKVFPKQEGALRHVDQYRNDVFKVLALALPSLNGLNQDFTASQLRNFLPINQKIKYSIVESTLGWVGLAGSVEDLRNVMYEMNNTLTEVKYNKTQVIDGVNTTGHFNDSPIKVDDIINRLANRLTLLNLPFIAADKVNHFWPVDGVAAEKKVWTNAFYSLVHTNWSPRKESKAMDTLAKSDMARMLKVLVADSKQFKSKLREQFFNIATELSNAVETEFAATLNPAEKINLMRELIINSRVNALMHMILDDQTTPQTLTYKSVKNHVRLEFAHRFNAPKARYIQQLEPALADARLLPYTSEGPNLALTEIRVINNDHDANSEHFETPRSQLSDDHDDETRSILPRYAQQLESEIELVEIRSERNLMQQAESQGDGASPEAIQSDSHSTQWFEMMRELNERLTTDSLSPQKIQGYLSNE